MLVLGNDVGDAAGDFLLPTMKGMVWTSPRGPMSIDPATGDVIHNIYIRKVENVNGDLQNVEFATFDAVRDVRTAVQ